VTAVRTVIAAAALILGASHPAGAQVYIGQGDTPRRGSIEVGGGGMWAPGFETGTRTAELTRSGQQSDRFDLFTSEGEVDGFPGAHARVGFYLTQTISIEGGARFAKPRLAYRLSGDAESAPDETATETLSHYVFDGSVLFHLPRASFGGGRGVPFLSGGAGYLRELHEGEELVETGTEIHVTGGVKYWFGSGRRLGLRVEAGLSAREKGFDREEGRRTVPLVLAGATFLF
jgi:hypothetical protein